MVDDSRGVQKVYRVQLMPADAQTLMTCTWTEYHDILRLKSFTRLKSKEKTQQMKNFSLSLKQTMDYVDASVCCISPSFFASSHKILFLSRQDSRFNQDVDKQTGYRTKSLLCTPIKNSDGEVWKKIV